MEVVKMKRKKHTSESSDEDIPVKMLKAASKSHSPKMRELTKYCVEKCEFCDEEFYNKYDILVHNSKHIVIPLAQEFFHQCNRCKSCFVAEEDLTVHITLTHNVPDILDNLFLKDSAASQNCTITNRFNNHNLEDIVKKEIVIKCEDSVNQLIIKNNEKTLENIVKSEAVVKCDDSVNELIIRNNEKTLEKIVKKEAIVACDNSLTKLIIGTKACKEESKENKKDLLKLLCKEDKEIIDDSNDCILISDDEDSKVFNDFSKTNGNIDIKHEEDNIKSRIIFEDDLEEDFEIDDDIIQFDNHFPDESYVLPDDIPLPVLEVLQERTSNDKCNGNSDMTLNPEILLKESTAPSIHYEELVEPSEHKCYRCKLYFPNRYKLIEHEVVHIKLRMRPGATKALCTECDRYIAGNHYTLKRHYSEKHPHCELKKRNVKKCDKCGLTYSNVVKHSVNYHFIYVCHICGVRFESEADRAVHMKTCRLGDAKLPSITIDFEKTVKVCEVCAMFMKNTLSVKYIRMGDYSREGMRTPCERCGNQFFELMLFKKLSKQYGPQSSRRKPLSNEERLKNIKKRLNKLNKLTRF